MRVNADKTQLLCIASAIHSSVSSHVTLEDGTRINSQDEVTLLGFRFGSRPTVSAHLQLIASKFNALVWITRHLKHPTKFNPQFCLGRRKFILHLKQHYDVMK